MGPMGKPKSSDLGKDGQDYDFMGYLRTRVGLKYKRFYA